MKLIKQKLSILRASLIGLTMLLSMLSIAPKAYAVSSSCFGHGVPYVCFDPTTAYGPLVYVFDGNGNFVWAAGTTIGAYCTSSNTEYYTIKHDGAQTVYYGYTTTIRATFSVFTGSCTGSSAWVTMPQGTLDLLRWYSNSVGVQSAQIVQ